MDTGNPALTFSLALAAGVLAQSLAQHLRVPGIVLLLLTGVLLGPDVLHVVHPDTLGGGLEILVALSVAIILFEGGLSLNLGRIRGEAIVIRRLITLGAAITAVCATIAAHYFMGWDWRVSILFGTLVIVTGPTVITPLLRRIRVNPNIGTILEAEGVLIDPVGAIVAVVALEVVLATTATSAAVGLLGIPTRLIEGAAVGAIGGFLIGVILRKEHFVPDGLENIFTLSLLLALFAISNAILAESGIMAAVMAGLVVGNMDTRLDRELREFKEQITVMLVGLLFVLLAADVRLSEVTGLGWGGVATVLALMLVIRPLGVAASTVGSNLKRNERIFIAWLGPRGIVAAAVASLFAERLAHEGIAEGSELRALVFLVIASTVVIQGLTGGSIAARLGVRRRSNNGYAIVGANPIGRTLARVLADGGESVVLIDSNPREIRAAKEEGFKVFLGNASEEGVLLRADVEGRRGFIATTPNEGVNLLLARKASETYKIRNTYVTLHSGKVGVRSEQVHEVRSNLLFGEPIDIEEWIHRLAHGLATVEQWRYGGSDEKLPLPALYEPTHNGKRDALLPLVITRNGRPIPASDEVRIQPGDVVTLVWASGEAEAVRKHLHDGGWEEVSREPAFGAPAEVHTSR